MLVPDAGAITGAVAPGASAPDPGRKGTPQGPSRNESAPATRGRGGRGHGAEGAGGGKARTRRLRAPSGRGSVGRVGSSWERCTGAEEPGPRREVRSSEPHAASLPPAPGLTDPVSAQAAAEAASARPTF